MSEQELPTTPARIAVIGSGIAGLSAAWLLGQRHEVTLFERAARLGGHTNTVVADVAGRTVPVDTGFIVYNEATYPNLTALFQHMGVATTSTDMTFAVSLDAGRLEYAGGDVSGLFAQRANLVRPRFWAMLSDIVRFYRQAPALLAEAEAEQLSLGDLIERGGYGEAFADDHLLPMAGAIWSAPAARMRAFPASTFIRFFENHGLLKLVDRPLWRTVNGGSREYVTRLMADFKGETRTGVPVAAIVRSPGGVSVRTAGGETAEFDEVVLATHADQALAMLRDADPLEKRLLGAFGYSQNRALLHTDPALMPRRRGAWASWNYLSETGPSETGNPEQEARLSVTYWMNSLQPLDIQTDLFVTLNPLREPAAGTILHEEAYEHPAFDGDALLAQRELWALQGRRRTWFCGAYFGAGFHEDGLQSGLAVAEQLGGCRRPWQVEGESGRICLRERSPNALQSLEEATP